MLDRISWLDCPNSIGRPLLANIWPGSPPLAAEFQDSVNERS